MDTKTRQILILSVIIIVAIVLRVYSLDKASLRADEGGTIFLSERQPLSILFNPQDSQPPLFYLITHFWTQIFGKTAFMLRLLPVALSVLCIPVIFKLGESLFNDKVGLFAAALFAVSQANIRYAQTLRMYPLMIILCCLSLYYFLEYLKKQNLANVLAFAVLSFLAVFAHYFAVFLIAAEFLYIFYYFRRKIWQSRKAIAGIASAMVVVAILVILYIHYTNSFSLKNDFEVKFVSTDPLAQLNLFSFNQNNIFVRMGLIFYQFSVGFLTFDSKNLLILAVAGLSAAVFAITGIASVKRMYYMQREKLGLVLLALIVPTAMLAAIWYLKIITPYTYARYLLFIAPVYYFLIAYGAVEGFAFVSSEKLKKIIPIAILCLIILFNAVTLNYYYEIDSQKENWAKISSEFNNEYKQGDLVVMFYATQFYNFRYYAKDVSSVYSPPDGLHLTSMEFQPVFKSMVPITEENSCNIMKITNEKTKSLWLVSAPVNSYDKGVGFIKDCFEKNGFSASNTIESSYISQKGENITDMRIYHFVK